MKSLYRTGKILTVFISVSLLISCRKFITADPPATSVNEANVFTTDATAAAALTGIYSKMANSFFSLDMTLLPELAADNLQLFSTAGAGTELSYFQNIVSPGGSVSHFWLTLYPYIYNTNAVIEGLTKSQQLTPAVKQYLLGEAYFLRGFYYFYLVNFYGNVPLVLSTDYIVNSKKARSDSAQVYSQIISDLKQAENLLSEEFLKADMSTYGTEIQEKVRPTKSAATALLARVYLFQKDWPNAELAATAVINKSTQFSLVALDQTFLKNSNETIWALQPVRSNWNTDEAGTFVLKPGEPGATQNIYLSDDIMNAFDAADQRRTAWTDIQTTGGTPYPYAAKYKIIPGNAVEEYSIILRLAELYLIRAEARGMQNNYLGASADLDSIRTRAGLPSVLVSDETSLVYAVLKERRTELFCEYGHRWLDLKRTGMIDNIMNAYAATKGATWQSYKSWFPVPTDELLLNKSLTQNSGY